MKLKPKRLLILLIGLASLAVVFWSPSFSPSLQRPLQAQSLPTVTFPSFTLPAIAAHINRAQNSGFPSVLTRLTDRAQIRRNRREACRGFISIPPLITCDEYPFASSYQGGAGSSTAAAPQTEQSIQGGILGAFYRVNQIPDRGPYLVRTV